LAASQEGLSSMKLVKKRKTPQGNENEEYNNSSHWLHFTNIDLLPGAVEVTNSHFKCNHYFIISETS
jgi:hypothetical protein